MVKKKAPKAKEVKTVKTASNDKKYKLFCLSQCMKGGGSNASLKAIDRIYSEGLVIGKDIKAGGETFFIVEV